MSAALCLHSNRHKVWQPRQYIKSALIPYQQPREHCEAEGNPARDKERSHLWCSNKTSHLLGLIKTQLRCCIIASSLYHCLLTQGCSTQLFEQENKIKLSVLTTQRERKTTLAVKVEERYRLCCAKGWSNDKKQQAWRNNYSMTDNMLMLHPMKLTKRWGVNAWGKDVSLVYIRVLQKITWIYRDREVSYMCTYSKQGTIKGICKSHRHPSPGLLVTIPSRLVK